MSSPALPDRIVLPLRADALSKAIGVGWAVAAVSLLGGAMLLGAAAFVVIVTPLLAVLGVIVGLLGLVLVVVGVIQTIELVALHRLRQDGTPGLVLDRDGFESATGVRSGRVSWAAVADLRFGAPDVGRGVVKVVLHDPEAWRRAQPLATRVQTATFRRLAGASFGILPWYVEQVVPDRPNDEVVPQAVRDYLGDWRARHGLPPQAPAAGGLERWASPPEPR